MTWSTIAPEPPEGWEGFESSNAVTTLLWLRLTGWHYLNFTSDTSVWEDPGGSGAMLHVGYSDERIVELTMDLADERGPAVDVLHELLAELESTFALRPRAPSIPPAA